MGGLGLEGMMGSCAWATGVFVCYRPVGFLNFANEACATRAIQKYQGWTGWGARGLNFEFVPGAVEDKSLKRTRDAFGKAPYCFCCVCWSCESLGSGEVWLADHITARMNNPAGDVPLCSTAGGRSNLLP